MEIQFNTVYVEGSAQWAKSQPGSQEVRDLVPDFMMGATSKSITLQTMAIYEAVFLVSTVHGRDSI